MEVWQDNQWQTLCAWPQFLPQDALVVCKQLGFSKGTVFPMAAYGRHTGNHTYPFKGCSGGETRIQDCKFDENYTPNVCATQDVHYGSVSCFDKQEGQILNFVPTYSFCQIASSYLIMITLRCFLSDNKGFVLLQRKVYICLLYNQTLTSRHPAAERWNSFYDKRLVKYVPPTSLRKRLTLHADSWDFPEGFLWCLEQQKLYRFC